MKRDARIGLAVVLVLGLSVTLLIGRALYRHGGSSMEGDSDLVAIDANTDPAHVDPNSPRTDSTLPLPANIQQPQNSAVEISDGARRFIDDQSHPITPNPVPAVPGRPTRDPITNNSADLDHEQVGAGRRNEIVRPGSTEYFAYTVTSGDSPWSVSNKVFGDGKYTQKIVEANELSTKKMKPGTILRIPSIPGKQMQMKLQPYADNSHGKTETPNVKPVAGNTSADKSGAQSSAKRTHKVETGETLSIIAKKQYGNNGPKTIQLIIAANHGLDPAKLKVGQEIALPAMK